MATIRARKRSDGTTRYTAIVRIRKGKAIVYQEYRTFALRTAAASWARHLEVELEDPATHRKQHASITLAELIRWYIETFETISKWQRSKQSHLEFLERHSIGKVDVLELTPGALTTMHRRTIGIPHEHRRVSIGAGSPAPIRTFW